MEKIDKRFKNIKVLVWDVDGTLYQSTAEYSLAARRKQHALLSQVRKISLAVAKELLEEKKKVYQSATKTLAELGCGPIAEVGRKIEVEGKRRFI